MRLEKSKMTLTNKHHQLFPPSHTVGICRKGSQKSRGQVLCIYAAAYSNSMSSVWSLGFFFIWLVFVLWPCVNTHVFVASESK